MISSSRRGKDFLDQLGIELDEDSRFRRSSQDSSLLPHAPAEIIGYNFDPRIL